MSKRRADSVYHYPEGSSLPGMADANPYRSFPPQELHRLVETERDPEKLAKIKSAIRQWDRIYRYPGYPFRITAALRSLAFRMLRKAEVPQPAVNVPYYQESDIPSGQGNVLRFLKNIDDNDDNARFDYNRQGERPLRDIDTGKGDFLSPSEPPIGDTVKTKGEGPDPEIYYPFPPTGGNLGGGI